MKCKRKNPLFNIDRRNIKLITQFLLLNSYVRKSSGPLVILTIPHAKCAYTPNQPHSCDYVAEPFARSISKYLGNVENIVYPSPNNRALECDMNRKWCRSWPYRTNLVKFVNREKRIGKVYVLDVHSFPGDYNPDEIKLAKPPEVYTIDDGRYVASYTSNFVNFMKQNGVDCHSFGGKGVNDIHQQMRQLGLQSFLVEFSEGLSKQRKEKICKLTSSWIKSYLIKN